MPAGGWLDPDQQRAWLAYIRVSHHLRRMSARGLVTCGPSAADRRVTEVA